MRTDTFEEAVAVSWPPDQPYPRIPQATVDRLYGCVRTTDALLGELGIPYLAIGGTLLGAYRHQGLIPWDIDADLAIRQQDIRRLRRDCGRFLAERGYGLARERRFGLLKIFPLDGCRIRPWHRFRFPYVDVFPMRERTDGRWEYASVLCRRRWPGQFLGQADFTTGSRCRFGPLSLSVPPEPAARRHLAASYGPVWRTEAKFDPYRIPGLRGTPDAVLTDFPPALPTTERIRRWEHQA